MATVEREACRLLRDLLANARQAKGLGGLITDAGGQAIRLGEGVNADADGVVVVRVTTSSFAT
ncbi:hypothetical protein [Streptomyces sp. NPDC017993]|uniref:hypothetical protein n=1 Tax=Streptomyces sp. NPDC017993 TaxID=3365027 RepID=UPI00378EDDA8